MNQNNKLIFTIPFDSVVTNSILVIILIIYTLKRELYQSGKFLMKFDLKKKSPHRQTHTHTSGPK